MTIPTLPRASANDHRQGSFRLLAPTRKRPPCQTGGGNKPATDLYRSGKGGCPDLAARRRSSRLRLSSIMVCRDRALLVADFELPPDAPTAWAHASIISRARGGRSANLGRTCCRRAFRRVALVPLRAVLRDFGRISISDTFLVSPATLANWVRTSIDLPNFGFGSGKSS